jgi:hypothetical protein
LKYLEDNPNPKPKPNIELERRVEGLERKVIQLEERNRILTLDNMEKDKMIAQLQYSIQKNLQQEIGKSKGLGEPIKKLVIKKNTANYN